VDFRSILETMIARQASDLHLRAGMPPVLRVNGRLTPLDSRPLSKDDLEAIVAQVMPEEQREQFAATREADFAFGISGVARFRANFYQQRGTVAATLRCVPLGVPRFEELHLPEAVGELVTKPRGLILVTGTVGSGKSTTLAAMIHRINTTMGRNIITVEDPIEFLHWNVKSIISQREIGTDTDNYAGALKRILRQDPDVILIGEIRDRETMSVALMAADTGHLVLSTLHTTDAAQTINRIVSFYPPHQHDEVRFLLSGSLEAIVSMRLLPRCDGKGRVPAVEVLMNTETIRECLRNPDETPRIREVMSAGANQYGMQTFDQSLMQLYRQGLITLEDALHHATVPTEFELQLKGIEASADTRWLGFADEAETDDAADEGTEPGADRRPPARENAATDAERRAAQDGAEAAKGDRRGGKPRATLFPELGPKTRRDAVHQRRKRSA